MQNFDETKDILRVQGVNAKGFGIIPKLVMQDPRLPIESKAIYAYFRSYAGAGDTAFPSINKICSDLGISDERFRKYFRPIKDCGYIEVEQQKEHGKFARNIYTLIEKPVCKSPSPQFPSTGNPDTQIRNDNASRGVPTLKTPYPEITSTGIPDTENLGTKNNSNTKNNSIKNNKKNTHTVLQQGTHIPEENRIPQPNAVCETASISVEQLQKDIQAVIGETIVLKRLEKLVHSSSVERIRYHLSNWHIHRQNQTQPGAGYFLTVVENDIPPVEPEKKPHWREHQVSRRDNFDQREYTDEELERFYVNLAEEEGAPPVPEDPVVELPVCELLPNPFIDTPEARNEGESDQ